MLIHVAIGRSSSSSSSRQTLVAVAAARYRPWLHIDAQLLNHLVQSSNRLNVGIKRYHGRRKVQPPSNRSTLNVIVVLMSLVTDYAAAAVGTGTTTGGGAVRCCHGHAGML